MTKRRRILMTMHRMSQGGADKVAVLLANGFLAAGIDTDFLLLRAGGEGEEVLSSSLDPGVRLHIAGPPMGSRHLELLRGIRFIREVAASIRPDVVLASSSNMGLVTGIACHPLRRAGLSVAMKLTNPVIRPRDRFALQRAYRRRLYRFIFYQHDRVLVLTDAERSKVSEIDRHISGRFVTVPNPYVTADLMAAELLPANDVGRSPRLITMARMMPQKRLDVLLRAFAQSQHRDARLTVLGDGPLRPTLETLARSLEIENRVDMPGFVVDVLPHLREANLFVLSSDYEGFPAAVIEALACNVPVVTTDCFPAAQEILDSLPCCAVTPVGDSVALASAIDASLACKNRTDLRAIAAGYTVQASIAEHIAALLPLMAAS